MGSRCWGLALVVLMCLSTGAALGAEPDTQAPPGWFHVIHLDAQTIAISEPHYWQQNVSYLLLGSRRAILFDTGPGLYSIHAVVRTLTSLPVLVIPSHLHFDHLGRIQEFDYVGLLDRAELKAQVRDGVFAETASQFMLENPTKFRVTEWISDGSTIELGGRAIRVINTPGHTPDSITLIDRVHQRAFTGDLVNRLVTLCDVPGSDVRQTQHSLKRLLSLIRPGGRAYEAHAEQPLEYSELSLLSDGVANIAAGHGDSKSMCLGGQPMLRYDIVPFAFVLPTKSDERLRPLKTVTQELDWQGGPCTEHP